MDDAVLAVHVQTRDRVAVLDALRAQATEAGLEATRDDGVSPRPGTVRFLVAPPRGAWVSVYPEESELGRDLCRDLARRLRARAILVGRLGEAACFYLACDAEGDPGDEYHSCPEQELESDQEEPDEVTLSATRGDPARLGATLGGILAPEKLGEVLGKARIERLADCDPGQDRPTVEQTLAALRAALRLPDLWPEFDEVRHFLAEEDGLDVALLAFRPPGKSRLEPVKAFLARFRRKSPPGPGKATAEPAADAAEDEQVS